MGIGPFELGQPRVHLGRFPTPLHRADDLGDLLGTADLWIKRDDLTGFSWGGNKVRPAEFLVADAMANGASELIVSGGPSSNFAAIIAVAGRVHGMRVHQVCYGSEPDRPFAALAAARQSGAAVTFTGSADRSTMDAVGKELAAEHARQGRVAYTIPRGGASDVGALGFVHAALELGDQLDAAGIDRATIVMPVGSGGSASGLVAGTAVAGRRWVTVGASVSRPPDETEAGILDKAVRCAALTGVALSPDRAANHLRVHDARGAGFGIADPEEARLADAVSQSTGLLVDATYNAKAMRWLATVDHLEPPVIYWHTGGALGAIDRLVLTSPEQTSS